MKNRNVSVDLFRFLAALSIMFLHTCWGLDDSLLDAYPIIGIVIGRYPVILFFTISGYYCFLQISKGRNAAKTQIRSLLKVYCVWTVVYYLMSFVLNVAAGHEPVGKFFAERVLYFFTEGSYPHLWYVVSLIYVMILICLVYELCGEKGIRILAAVSMILFMIGVLGTSYLLSGEGADELFGGYPMYLAGMHFDHYTHRTPRAVRKALGAIAARLPAFKGRNFLIRGAMEPYQRFMRSNYVYTRDNVGQYLKKDYHPKDPVEYVKPLFERVKDLDEPSQLQYVDIYTWMLYDILQKADRMSMANSLELRVPFLDKRMLELAMQIPSRYRVQGETTKVALRGAALKQLPERTANKKKLGFPVPLNDWLREDKYYTMVKEKFENSPAACYFNQEAILKLLEQHKAGQNHMQPIWSVYSFLLWYDEFFVKR